MTDSASNLDRVDALQAELDALRPLTDEQVGRAMQRLRLEWTYHSNAIEGNSLSYGETRALLMEGVTAHGKPLKDHLDIERHRDVVLYIEEFVNSTEPIRVDFVKEIHHRLMGDEYEIEVELPDSRRERRTRKGGDYKEHPNNVRTPTGEIHYYAPPVEVPGRMAELMESLRSPEADEMHPVARLAVFHHRFVEIHPFPDGNGRTSRVLMNVLLMRAGYVPAVLRQERRSIYYGALAEAGAGDDDPIITFVANELAETLELYLRAVKGEPDPSAFDKRVALLQKTAQGSSSEHGLRSPESVKMFGRDFVYPLANAIGQGILKLAGTFARTSYEDRVVLSDGSLVVDQEAWSALHRSQWRTLTATWRLHEHLSDPTATVTVGLKTSAGEDHVTVEAIVGSRRIVTETYPYAPIPNREDVERISQPVLFAALEEAEGIAVNARR
ncbi:MAG: hypothetical protein Rubg2KO_11750 [Rubricoccaceae bacterium]